MAKLDPQTICRNCWHSVLFSLAPNMTLSVLVSISMVSFSKLSKPLAICVCVCVCARARVCFFLPTPVMNLSMLVSILVAGLVCTMYTAIVSICWT